VSVAARILDEPLSSSLSPQHQQQKRRSSVTFKELEKNSFVSRRDSFGGGSNTLSTPSTSSPSRKNSFVSRRDSFGGGSNTSSTPSTPSPSRKSSLVGADNNTPSTFSLLSKSIAATQASLASSSLTTQAALLSSFPSSLPSSLSSSPHSTPPSSLTYVDVRGCACVDDCMLAMLGTCAALRHLDVSHCVRASDAGIEQLVGGAARLSLRSAVLASQMGDRAVWALARSCALLCRLGVDACVAFTDDGMRCLGKEEEGREGREGKEEEKERRRRMEVTVRRMKEVTTLPSRC